MRAIIRCYSTATKEQWAKILRHCEWWSSVPQDDDVVTTQYEQILNLIADEDRQLVKKTYWFMIFNSDVKSWGLVNSPQNDVLEFRIRNHSSVQLRQACEHFISAVMNYAPKQGNPGGLEFEFSENIEVLEANSQHLAFYGEVLPPKKWELARNERRQDWKLAKWSLYATVLLTVVTIPPIESVLFSRLPYDWRQWLDGNLARFSTSALVAALVAVSAVLTHYFELRRDGAVRWLLKAT